MFYKSCKQARAALKTFSRYWQGHHKIVKTTRTVVDWNDCTFSKEHGYTIVMK